MIKDKRTDQKTGFLPVDISCVMSCVISWSSSASFLEALGVFEGGPTRVLSWDCVSALLVDTAALISVLSPREARANRKFMSGLWCTLLKFKTNLHLGCYQANTEKGSQPCPPPFPKTRDHWPLMQVEHGYLRQYWIGEFSCMRRNNEIPWIPLLIHAVSWNVRNKVSYGVSIISEVSDSLRQ